jgi:predicted AlkP superfamily phosphohydrolase/phosphomutase
MSDPLVVLVLDGGDWRVVESLDASGRLPALRRFRERAATVTFDTPADVVEEAVWPSLLSGLPPGDHASYFFYAFEPETMGLEFRREADIEPFWLHLPGRGAGALVLDPPQMHPHAASAADQSCGWHLWSSPHRRAVYSSAELRRALGPFRPPTTLTEFDHPPTEDDERRLGRVLVDSVALRGRAADVLGRDRAVFLLGVHEPHAIAHCLSHHYEPGHWHAPASPDPTLVTGPYEAIDRALARQLDRGDANVVVVFAQGFRPANSAADLLEPLLERAGLLARAGGDGTAGPASRMARLTSAARGAVPQGLQQWLAEHVVPEPVATRFQSAEFRGRYDWPATQVFPVPTWTIGYLRFNVAGREAAGVVAPADVPALTDRVVELLRATVDADTGRPLVTDVLPAAAFPGARQTEWPDLFVVWASDRPVHRARHPQLGEWAAGGDPPRWRWGEHRAGGTALLAGPGVRVPSGPVAADMLGLAPTLLALAGARPTSVMPEGPWRDVVG